MSADLEKRVLELLKELHLPAIRDCFLQKIQEAATENLNHLAFLRELLEMEWSRRRQKSIERRLRESNIPLEKTFDLFKMERFEKKLSYQIGVLRKGEFLKRRENVLAFGKPGTGKTHLLCAIGAELVLSGYNVYFSNCSLIVQELLRAKAELRLDRYLKKLSRFDALILDDIGYVQQNREEMEVLFTLLAARYERGSVLLTSNLPFSKWENIFKDPMTTAAAIDRLVHHSVILELNVPSYRMEQAQKRSEPQNKEISNE